MPRVVTLKEVAKSHRMTVDEFTDFIAFAKSNTDIPVNGDSLTGESKYGVLDARKLFEQWKSFRYKGRRPVYFTLEDFAKRHGLTNEDCSALVKFASRTHSLHNSYSMDEEPVYNTEDAQKLLELWKSSEDTRFKTYASSLVASGASSKNDLAYGYYLNGIATVDAFANDDKEPLPMVLRIDRKDHVLRLQTADFVENPIEYKVRITLPLNKILWAALKPVSGQPDHDVAEPVTSDLAGARTVNYYLAIFTANGDALIFSVPFTDAETNEPDSSYYAFVRELRILSPFYRKEDGIEYFNVEL